MRRAGEESPSNAANPCKVFAATQTIIPPEVAHLAWTAIAAQQEFRSVIGSLFVLEGQLAWGGCDGS